MTTKAQKIVLCGVGFLGSNIARTLADTATQQVPRQIQIASRSPEAIYNTLKKEIPDEQLLQPVNVDITRPNTLGPALKGANVVVSLVGLLHGSPDAFNKIQWQGTANVAKAAKDAGAKMIYISAIGADKTSNIPYMRTKALAEEVVFEMCPNATIIRPSLLFGPGDGFFARFAKISKFLPFLPVFGGGLTRFQPVFVGDVARAVEIACRINDEKARRLTDGKVIWAGGPQVLTYKEMMEEVLKHTNRWRPIISFPYAFGKAQGLLLERLP